VSVVVKENDKENEMEDVERKQREWDRIRSEQDR
jgi:hypothetical protein